jgi:hypothetical protein
MTSRPLAHDDDPPADEDRDHDEIQTDVDNFEHSPNCWCMDDDGEEDITTPDPPDDRAGRNVDCGDNLDRVAKAKEHD